MVASENESGTAVMTDQVDIGWAAPPFGLDQIDKRRHSHARHRQ
jgi:hypothetical protein